MVWAMLALSSSLLQQQRRNSLALAKVLPIEEGAQRVLCGACLVLEHICEPQQQYSYSSNCICLKKQDLGQNTTTLLVSNTFVW